MLVVATLPAYDYDSPNARASKYLHDSHTSPEEQEPEAEGMRVPKREGGLPIYCRLDL